MVKYAGKIPKESIVQIKAKVQKAEVKSCTISDLELVISEIFTVNRADPMLPFQIEDASRVVLD
jgi:aspartyl/asparaginyl-tRNA synthetase